MLSDDLCKLACYFREHEFDGLTLAPREVRRVAEVLAQYTLDAGAMERRIEDPPRVDMAAFEAVGVSPLDLVAPVETLRPRPPARAPAEVLPFPLAGGRREPEPAA